MLVHAMPESSTTEGRWVCSELRELLETAVVQQAESSASRTHGASQTSPQPCLGRIGKPRLVPSLLEHRYPIGPPCFWTASAIDARCRETMRWSAGDDTTTARGYHPHRGGHYDSGEDHSPSPEPPGPRVFSRAIHATLFPASVSATS
jgi:hypothetical protein